MGGKEGSRRCGKKARAEARSRDGETGRGGDGSGDRRSNGERD